MRSLTVTGSKEPLALDASMLDNLKSLTVRGPKLKSIHRGELGFPKPPFLEVPLERSVLKTDGEDVELGKKLTGRMKLGLSRFEMHSILYGEIDKIDWKSVREIQFFDAEDEIS